MHSADCHSERWSTGGGSATGGGAAVDCETHTAVSPLTPVPEYPAAFDDGELDLNEMMTLDGEEGFAAAGGEQPAAQQGQEPVAAQHGQE